ncbi:hypothetical protein MUK71_01015 [Arthrobacter zhangbolii]|uniref:Uncharacterized protein n=1 Tax=Arthrobacter zhangbolii TaxID=2886936 RepID=A0A9X1MB25_9MICC|nr:hypothetical protein [Arthrobacter zhangbolii]MCC3274202.1 hypothetical protein [Arthrobacter zhangbolii]MCC3296104.1 hypothetical protein [Arthrobacter zhangbolii]UON92272.1 hypothetical protein MUK71_01015 [Arthrobacter zhangbolii]
MSIEARPEDLSGADSAGPGEFVPWCSYCGTDEFLIIESVEPAAKPGSGEFLEINYTCAECDRFYGHPIRHSSVWARCTVRSEDDAADYMHCGEPMQPRDHRQQSIFEPLTTSSMQAQAPADVQLDTTVLRCHCGFQLEIPA